MKSSYIVLSFVSLCILWYLIRSLSVFISQTAIGAEEPTKTTVIAIKDLVDNKTPSSVAVNLVTKKDLPATLRSSSRNDNVKRSLEENTGNLVVEDSDFLKMCSEKYRHKRFLSSDLVPLLLPPLLYTFPGSGNTWSRLLLEYATGIFTGSIYNDRHILNTLHGELTCDWTVSIIKAHPLTHSFVGKFGLGQGSFNSDKKKCQTGNIKVFKRAILLIRNPFDAIWSEFQRRMGKGNHVNAVSREKFPWEHWKHASAWLAYRYKEMVNVHYAGLIKNVAPGDVLTVRYEDLRNKAIRIDQLKAMTDFLQLKPSHERLSCAFPLSDDKGAHRHIDKSKNMNKKTVFTKEIACGIWGVIGKEATKYGYGFPKDLDFDINSPEEISSFCGSIPPMSDNTCQWWWCKL